jgi:Raf kinase inhibitor-like YbhB/YbcL family protein
MMTRYRRARVLASAVAGAAGLSGLAGCGLVGQAGAKSADLADWFTVTSPAFRDGKPIPSQFACAAYQGGQGKTPPLNWSFPDGAAAFAIVVDDPDAPKGVYVHWVVANIDGHTNAVVAGARLAKTVEGENSGGTVGYQPPCPPKGQPAHRYRFTVYALNEPVPMKASASLKDSLPMIAQRTIGRGRITGNFGGR